MSFVFKDSMYDPAVLELVHDPDQVPVYRRLTGLIGPGNTDEKIRIYTWDLSGHVEVAKSDVVYIEKMPNGEGAIVFLKGGAQDQQSAIQNAYLQGQMTQAVQTLPPPTYAPWCFPTQPLMCPATLMCPPHDNEAKVAANQVGVQALPTLMPVNCPTFPTWPVNCPTLMPGCPTSYPTSCPPHDDQAKATADQPAGAQAAMAIPTIIPTLCHCPTLPVTKCLDNQANVMANQTTGGPAAMTVASLIPTVCCPTINHCPSIPVSHCRTIPKITC